MKKLLITLLCASVCFGLVGCGSNDDSEPWMSVLEKRLEELGIDDIKEIDNSSYKEGDENVNAIIETKKAKLEADLYLYEDRWDVSKVKEYHGSKIYYLDITVIDQDNYDIYDYKTGKINRPRKEIEISNGSNELGGISKSVQFIKNGYHEFNGNFRKDVDIDGSNMYMLFTFYDDANLNLFTVSDENGNDTSYYYNAGWGGQNYCKFDYTNGSAKAGATCSEDEITNANYVKGIFEKELVNLGLTIDDLNK